MDIIIKRMETEEEIRGKAYVHWQSWHEAYPDIVSGEYLEKLTLEKCEQMAFTWPQNTFIALDDGRVVGFVCWGSVGEASPETGEIIASTALSAAQSLTEVKTLLAGGKVDNIGLEMYLRLLLALLPRNEKLARLMDIMELNIRFVDGANFSFRNYAYGFELEAEFALKKRSGDVSQTFVYH